MRKDRIRRGMTLIELLVVIGIIAILVGLLVPAVQNVRAAAARVHCGNNLHQMGLAFEMYHDDLGGLPPGVSSAGPRQLYPRMAWPAYLLPYLEQSALWGQTQAAYSFQRSPFFNPPHIGLDMPMKAFSCPLDGRTLQPQLTHNGRRVALTSYVGVLGTDHRTTDGVLFLDSRVRFLDILDGQSNTVMVGERPPSADAWYGWWYASVGQSGSGSPDVLLGAREFNLGAPYLNHCPRGPYRFSPGRIDDNCSVLHYWSLHPRGGYFLFADGSVQFLNYSASDILPMLATRSGGEAVEPY